MRLRRAKQWTRKRHGTRIAPRRQRLDRRAAGIAEAEQLGGLVERLAGSIVDGRREPPVVTDAAHFEQLAMAARHQQEQIREAEVRIGQPRAKRVTLEMIDGDQRLAGREREALAGKKRDHDAADQAGPGGGGDSIDIANRNAGLAEDVADQRRQNLDVRAGGDFGNNAAIRLMSRSLADDFLGKDVPIRRDKRRGAVVARGFQSEDHSHCRVFQRFPLAALCLNASPCTRGGECRDG